MLTARPARPGPARSCGGPGGCGFALTSSQVPPPEEAPGMPSRELSKLRQRRGPLAGTAAGRHSPRVPGSWPGWGEAIASPGMWVENGQGTPTRHGAPGLSLSPGPDPRARQVPLQPAARLPPGARARTPLPVPGSGPRPPLRAPAGLGTRRRREAPTRADGPGGCVDDQPPAAHLHAGVVVLPLGGVGGSLFRRKTGLGPRTPPGQPAAGPRPSPAGAAWRAGLSPIPGDTRAEAHAW